MSVNWEMGRSPNIIGNALAAFEDGKKLREERNFKAAMADYLNPSAMKRSPGDISPAASVGRNALLPQDSTGQKMAQKSGAPLNALMGAIDPTPPPASNTPMTPVAPGTSFQDAFSPYATSDQHGAQAPSTQSIPANEQQDSGPDLSFLGEPQTAKDRAFLRMLQIDPEKAIKVQSTLRDNFLHGLKAEHEFYDLAVEDLSHVSDEAGWQAALHRLAPVAEGIGGNLLDHVPANYPGPEAVQALLEKAMPIKDRLTHLLTSANIAADNARADRNTDSLISDRDARRAETRRYHGERDTTTRRGQDIRAGAASRRDATTRRGQDIRGSTPRRGGSARPTATDAHGNKVEFDGRNWVPVK